MKLVALFILLQVTGAKPRGEITASLHIGIFTIFWYFLTNFQIFEIFLTNFANFYLFLTILQNFGLFLTNLKKFGHFFDKFFIFSSLALGFSNFGTDGRTDTRTHGRTDTITFLNIVWERSLFELSMLRTFKSLWSLINILIRRFPFSFWPSFLKSWQY